MSFIFNQLRTHNGRPLTVPPQLVAMTGEALVREIKSEMQSRSATIVLEYGTDSFELVVGMLNKSYDIDQAVSWWVGDRLVATADNDHAPIIPAPSLVFIRAGWVYPLTALMMDAAA